MSEQPPGPAAQQRMLERITLLLAHALPAGWEESTVVHRAVGGHTETLMQVRMVSQRFPTLVEPHPELAGLFQELRSAMYRPGVGTWFSAIFRLTFPFSFDANYDNREEPDWRDARPPAAAYEEELRLFPREPGNVPGWLAAATGAAEADDGLRMAKPFDSMAPDGAPVVQRAPVPDGDRDAVVRYLQQAPIVLAARSFDTDLLDPQRASSVPLTYHTDGTWIWPGAVGYYLKKHGLPPEPDLVAHIRAAGFQLPEVSEDARKEAVNVITSPSG
ncbi:hypothetical protein [Actinomadura rugatobispora]|uniref:Uncharacterized protein n=1 Tax=Actinomadura rugatobispora TaxID=1994 RepID=A0ABW0ZQY5_9ACTN|nr:hypothetical protein GCM10010200_027880 [Actinomadura rugatobispora]